MVLLAVTDEPLDYALFEVISAFATCGLSMGVTERSTDAGLYVLSALMLVGRLGTITLASALSERSQKRRFRYAEERPIIG
jgi:Trk-type K+ transport system membrane component